MSDNVLHSIEPGITILGLGPGDPGLITRQAWKILETCHELWLRTRQHPVVNSLPETIRVHSFDSLYENGDDFPSVYAAIVSRILELGQRPGGVVYAVPGHPYIAEATTPEIVRQAKLAGIPVHVVAGISFLEPVFTALGIDPLPHTVLFDALELVSLQLPPFPPSTPALIVQIYSRPIASDVKLTLNAIYPDEHPVFLVHAAGTPEQTVENLKLFEIDRSNKIGLQTVLYLPSLGPSTSFEAFQEVIARLRAPDGCPWDREQTHLSLRRYLLEETYEVLQALDKEDIISLCEELGDLLLQVVLHTQIAAEAGDFTMSDVLRLVNEKIVRRHPHVFGEVKLEDSSAVLQNWESLKAEERNQKGEGDKDLFEGVALALPALVQAEQYLLRASRVGYKLTGLHGGIQIINELFQKLPLVEQAERIQLIGKLLFMLVELARCYEIDPESALRNANASFRDHFLATLKPVSE